MYVFYSDLIQTYYLISVMDLSMEFSILVMGLVCTFYTAIVSVFIAEL